jgi:hypothetical protein
LVEKTILAARTVALEGAAAALADLGLDGVNPELPAATGLGGLSPAESRLRLAFVERARWLAEGQPAAGWERLVEAVAAETWFGRLLERFLYENDFLQATGVQMDPAGAEGAPQSSSPAQDNGSPGSLALDSLYHRVRLPGESLQRLEGYLAGLPAEAFHQVENLGWMVQAWQRPRKQALSQSEWKVGGTDLGPATQLFTEAYMVDFLLENTLGAWWAARRPESPLVGEWTYLRRSGDSASGPLELAGPAAGSYPGWPQRAALVTVMDPCCGTGHFLVRAFRILVRMRMEEEGLGEAEAAEAVLRENLFGLDLDPLCVQIAAFSLVMEAWRHGGCRPVPRPKIELAGSLPGHELLNFIPFQPEYPPAHDNGYAQYNPASNGIHPAGMNTDQKAQAGLRRTIDRLERLYETSPGVGSLAHPASAGVAVGGASEDASPAAVRSNSLPPLARTARLLAGRYVLVATNVPYLGRRKQAGPLREFLADEFPQAKNDLATAFLVRCLQFCSPGGTATLVTPQNWLFLRAYQALRHDLLASVQLNFVVTIGELGFSSSAAAGAFTALIGLTRADPPPGHTFFGLDAAAPRKPDGKSRLLRSGPLLDLAQAAQLGNPEARIILAPLQPGRRLGDYARSLVGLQTGDNPAYLVRFWEVERVGEPWALCLTAATAGDPFGGRMFILRWEDGRGRLVRDPQARLQGLEAVGKRGVAVLRVRAIRAFHYLGELYDQNVAVILPHDPRDLEAIWAYCASPEFARSVRQIDRKLNVTNATLAKVPFDLEQWRQEAGRQEAGRLEAERLEAGQMDPMPAPASPDPANWLFSGDPAHSTNPLQVAVARLLGYRWPAQTPDSLDEWAVEAGWISLNRAPGEVEPAADQRLRSLLAAAYGEAWSPELETALLSASGAAGKGLGSWLRDGFFSGHCRLFYNRPFIWHIWDGRKDGFSILANYHRLDAARLDRLVTFDLQNWIERQERAVRAGEHSAGHRLAAALALQKRLKAVLAGEPPYDLYARWKPLARQPVGWQPDFDDGVRVNIRPFVTAGVLRCRFNLHWRKDRGKNPDGSDRLNDLHYSPAEKRAAGL